MLTASVGVMSVSQSATGAPETRVAGSLSANSVSVPPVLGGSTLASTTSAVSAALASSSTGPVFLAAHGNDLALAQASANASQANGLALSAAGTDPTAVLAQLSALGPASVELVGPPAGFPQALLDALDVEYTVGTFGVAAQAIDWSPAAEDATMRANVVVGNPTVANSAEAAANLATVTGASLLLLDGTEPIGAIETILNDPSNELITVMGGNTALTTFDQLAETAGDRIASFDTTDLGDTELAVAFEAVSTGSAARSVVASTTKTAGGYATAALVARYTGGVTVSTANASQYVKLLTAPMSAPTVVGVGASTTMVTALQAAQVTHQSAPAFRVTNTTVTPTTFSVTHTGYTGAARYAAYDLEGNEVASSTTTTISIPGTPESTAIAALNSAGSPIATLQYKVNEYETSADRSQVVIGSTSGPTNHFVFLGTQNLPRLVTRTPISITGEAPDPANDTVNVALTCATTYTDASQPKTWQYLYRVTTLSQDPAACGATGAPGDSSIRDVAGVTFPATEYPMLAAKSAQAQALSTPDPAVQATGSILERAIANQFAAADAAGSGITAFAPGDDWAPIKFRYQAFIPESKIWAPGISGSLSRPFQFFHGDNRWVFTPNGSYRYRMDATVTFGSGHNVQYQEWMGQSIKYACRWPNGSDCVEMQRKTAPLSELWIQDVAHTNTSARFIMAARASNPVHALAPPIDGGVGFNLKRGGSTIRGTHDMMPRHEVWFMVVGWNEWYYAYGSSAHFVACLQASVAPGCTANFNVRI